jgi:hypothetical protein
VEFSHVPEYHAAVLVVGEIEEEKKGNMEMSCMMPFTEARYP